MVSTNVRPGDSSRTTGNGDGSPGTRFEQATAVQTGASVTAPAVGRGWQERYLGGSPDAERELITGFVGDIHTLQQATKRAQGLARFHRGFHAKMLCGILDAEFRIAQELPDDLQVGYFRPGNVHKATVRFSTSSNALKWASRCASRPTGASTTC
jgi:hypothetical protein